MIQKRERLILSNKLLNALLFCFLKEYKPVPKKQKLTEKAKKRRKSSKAASDSSSSSSSSSGNDDEPEVKVSNVVESALIISWVFGF